MISETFSNRTRLFLMAFDQVKRSAVSQILKSPLYKWRYSVQSAEYLTLMPQDLRTADPSFGTEVYHGHFGLAGTVAITDNISPFKIRPPNKIWEEDLHGFGWLRHFSAAPSDKARAQVQMLLRDWMQSSSYNKQISYQPEVVARRIISWLSHVGHHIGERDNELYDQVMRNLTSQIHYLSGYYAYIPDGYPRLLALIALVLSGFCLSDQESFVEDYLEPLCNELDRQIFEDGGHISRNPWVPVELILDLLPLKQCFITYEKEPPEEISQSIKRILSALHFMRLGDGYLARFNGMAATSPDTIATLLSYDEIHLRQPQNLPQSGYSSLSLGTTKLIMDTNGPPELMFSSQAHAGCLSFEVSVGIYPLIVNCGAPGPANQDWRLTSRTTPYHSTLSINKSSCSNILQNSLLERYMEGPLITNPESTKHSYHKDTSKLQLEAEHNGFASQYGVIYSRAISLSERGNRIAGKEYLHPTDRPALQPATRFPFALHFHVHPDVQPRLAKDKKTILLELPNGDIWSFRASDMTPSLEESLFFADFRGPRRTIQIVLRGAHKHRTEFSWILERTQDSNKNTKTEKSLNAPKASRLVQPSQKLLAQEKAKDKESTLKENIDHKKDKA
ncbi:MAG: heparinase II/III family protein [Pseudomonadota bacterium]